MAASGPDSLWTFWKRWYRGTLEGKPLDRDLQLQVALMEDAVWDAGPKAVAEQIARIEEDLQRHAVAPERREPQYEPKDVAYLFDAPKTVAVVL